MADDPIGRYLPHLVALVGMGFVTILIASTPVAQRLGIRSELISAAALAVVLAVVYLFATGRV